VEGDADEGDRGPLFFCLLQGLGVGGGVLNVLVPHIVFEDEVLVADVFHEIAPFKSVCCWCPSLLKRRTVDHECTFPLPPLVGLESTSLDQDGQLVELEQGASNGLLNIVEGFHLVHVRVADDAVDAVAEGGFTLPHVGVLGFIQLELDAVAVDLTDHEDSGTHHFFSLLWLM